MSQTPHDPWAHRRGEPRVFALAWSLYLLAAVTGAILWIVQGHTTTDAAGPAARIVLVVILIGVSILWPMVRLSQRSPRLDDEHPRSSCHAALLDMLIVFVPAQVIVWPLSWLAHWPLEIAAAMFCVMGGWSLAAGAAIALGTGPLCPSSPRIAGPVRTAWMLLWLAVLAAPAVAWGMARPDRGWAVPAWAPTASPISAVHAITGDTLSGVIQPVAAEQWRAVAAPALLGTLGWVVAVIAELAKPIRNPSPRTPKGNLKFPLDQDGAGVDNQ